MTPAPRRSGRRPVSNRAAGRSSPQVAITSILAHAFGQADLSDSAKTALDALVEKLKPDPETS
jgi:hypothetical protein